MKVMKIVLCYECMAIVHVQCYVGECVWWEGENELVERLQQGLLALCNFTFSVQQQQAPFAVQGLTQWGVQ